MSDAESLKMDPPLEFTYFVYENTSTDCLCAVIENMQVMSRSECPSSLKKKTVNKFHVLSINKELQIT